MKERTAAIGLPAIAILGAMLLLHTPAAAQQQGEDAKKRVQIERGKYLVTIIGCGCHTPRIRTPEGEAVEDSARLLSGYPAESELPEIPEGMFSREGMFPPWRTTVSYRAACAGPWGVSFPRNLTPDVETGLGSWTEEIFIKALRTGKDMGEGRDILPPMPWRKVSKLSDEDLKAIFAFLGSLEPIENAVPDPITPTGERLTTLRKPPQ